MKTLSTSRALHNHQASNAVRLWLKHLLIAVLISALVISLACVALLQEKQRYRERASVATQNIASLLDQQISGVFDKIDLALQTSQNFYADMEASGAIDPVKLNQHLMQQHAVLPEVTSLRIIDASGIVRFGTELPATVPVNLSDREYFAQARDKPSTKLIVYGPIFARITQKWVVILARRLNAADGSFAGVVYANVACEYFENILSLVSLGPNGAATIRNTDLALVHRVPDTKNAVGSKDVSRQLREAITAKPNGGEYIGVTKLDGVERSNAFRRLKTYPFYVIVGLATNDYLGGWQQNVVIIALLTGLTLIVTWLASIRSVLGQRRLNDDIQKRIQISQALEQALTELEVRKTALEAANTTLEQKVFERTAELSKANQELERLARRDALTRLGNRLAADEHLHEEFLRMKRNGTAYSLLLVDIDHFKQVNDRYGHEQGDVVLKQVAWSLNRSCRATDFIARFGGEEFLAVLPETSQDHAALVAEKMRIAIAAVEIPPAGRITVSIGVTGAKPDDQDENCALRRADKNLYKAKTNGRNQVADDSFPCPTGAEPVSHHIA